MIVGQVWLSTVYLCAGLSLQIPENEHPGLRTGLFYALGLTMGESILPNIHDQPIPLPDASQVAQEVCAHCCGLPANSRLPA